MNLVTMRPPMQAPSLQQQHDYIHHHQHQQQPSLLTTATSAATAPSANQKKLKPNPNPKDFLLEASSASTIRTTFAQPVPPKRNGQKYHRKEQPQPLKQKQAQKQHHRQEQHQQQVQKETQLSQRFRYDNLQDSIQLVDLCSSGCSANNVSFHELTHCQSTAAKTPSNSVISSCPSYQRSSFSDDGSYAIRDKLCFSTPTPIFDDPAENFIINFPAADSPTHNRSDDKNDVVTNLPLSEAEPLIETGIDGKSVADKQRSALCLSKNSASLIFTRKDLSQQQPFDKTSYRIRRESHINSFRATPGSTNNNFVRHQKQKCVGPVGGANKPQNPGANNEEPARLIQRSLQENHRQEEKEFSAYHQQHRRSLQLNYNNNLISNFTDSSSSNNNSCWPSPLTPPIKSNFSHVGHSTTIASGKTAAATRKQHAYSWYAPVYSALEEELEQDSRDSSPVHNLANTKKLHSNHYHRRSVQNATAADNETDFLLETRNQINIQAQLHLQSQNNSKGNGNAGGGGAATHSKAVQPPNSLPLPHHLNNFSQPASEVGNGSATAAAAAATSGSSCDVGGEGPHAGSLGLAGGPLPRLKRWENLIKNFFIRPSNGSRGGEAISSTSAAPNSASIDSPPAMLNLPASPEIRITRTPSEQNVVVMRDQAAGRPPQVQSEKLASVLPQGSSSSLNVVQQKLWNVMRREGSASSLNQEKSNSIVQYRGMRKCETVLALSRPLSSVCSPVLGAGPGIIGGASTPHMGSGIFSAKGVEQIRPLNRMRNSVSSMHATCSRCSSLLSLAASGSRYSLNIAANGTAGSFVNTAQGAASRHQLQTPPVGRHQSHSRIPQLVQQGHESQKQADKIPSSLSNSNVRNRSNAIDSKIPSRFIGRSSRKSSGATSCTSPPPSNVTTASLTPLTSALNTPTKIIYAASTSSSKGAETLQKQPITVTSLLTTAPRNADISSSSSSLSDQGGGGAAATSPTLSKSTSGSLKSSQNRQQPQTKDQQTQTSQQPPLLTPPLASSTSPVERRFEMFTCKLCLVDVEAAEEATTLTECGCQFCTECMKAYIEFEISEGAYEISCPDAQCSAQGVITLPEIANLTTTNLMKKHHRYRLNREIELDKSRTWCPRAGCETVCLVGAGTQNDAAPSTSTSHSAAMASLATSPASTDRNGSDMSATSVLLCAVQCPSCKDEFCSACKKTWHPNLSCEENSRRLVADGQDDIGIPFDSDLIKCCPMCAVPIEKDEGCAQMMCKRCKHVFCWYCLASLDDDFLLRHYDKGPCKNKLGHSRASVVWHRAQVIGIFAGFGILLLVASPLLLLAAPCIICCKCRVCSGSKVDEVDGEMDEATALQS